MVADGHAAGLGSAASREGVVKEAIGAVLAFAVGVGVSPIPLIAVILMLFTERSRVNGPLFLVGWVLGLSVVAGGAYLLAAAIGLGNDPEGTQGVAWAKVALGVLLLVAAGRKWRKRPRAGEDEEMPAWMAKVDSFGPGKAFGLAVALSANPKNLLLAAGAGSSLAQLDLAAGQVVGALAAFVAIGSLAVAVTVGYDVVGGARARKALDGLKAWLAAHNDAVLAVLYLVFGAVLLAQALDPRS